MFRIAVKVRKYAVSPNSYVSSRGKTRRKFFLKQEQTKSRMPQTMYTVVFVLDIP